MLSIMFGGSYVLLSRELTTDMNINFLHPYGLFPSCFSILCSYLWIHSEPCSLKWICGLWWDACVTWLMVKCHQHTNSGKLLEVNKICIRRY